MWPRLIYNNIVEMIGKSADGDGDDDEHFELVQEVLRDVLPDHKLKLVSKDLIIEELCGLKRKGAVNNVEN